VRLRVRLRPEACAEIAHARDWYEARRAALGDEFVAEVDALLSKVAEHPAAYPRVRRAVRRAVLRRFPYAVYFRVIEEAVVVLAVVHGHRHPRVGRSRR